MRERGKERAPQVQAFHDFTPPPPPPPPPPPSANSCGPPPPETCCTRLVKNPAATLGFTLPPGHALSSITAWLDGPWPPVAPGTSAPAWGPATTPPPAGAPGSATNPPPAGAPGSTGAPGAPGAPGTTPVGGGNPLPARRAMPWSPAAGGGDSWPPPAGLSVSVGSAEIVSGCAVKYHWGAAPAAGYQGWDLVCGPAAGGKVSLRLPDALRWAAGPAAPAAVKVCAVARNGTAAAAADPTLWVHLPPAPAAY